MAKQKLFVFSSVADAFERGQRLAKLSRALKYGREVDKRVVDKNPSANMRVGTVTSFQDVTDGRLQVQWQNEEAPCDATYDQVLFRFHLKGVTKPWKQGKSENEKNVKEFAFMSAGSRGPEVVDKAKAKAKKQESKFSGSEKSKKMREVKSTFIAVGSRVEHPTHGVGFVCGHTQTDGVVEVNFDLESSREIYNARGIAVEGIEVHQDELKLVELVPKAKSKFKKGDRVEHPSHGVGYIEYKTATNGVYEVFFEKYWSDDYKGKDEFKVFEVHQDELKLVESRPKVKSKFKKGDQVDHAVHGRGQIAAKMGTDGIYGVTFDGASATSQPTAVHENDLKLVESPSKAKKIKFEDIGLFHAFVSKRRTFVKVSKSNAIACVVQGASTEPFAMLATSESRMNGDSIQRFKKSTKVEPYVGC